MGDSQMRVRAIYWFWLAFAVVLLVGNKTASAASLTLTPAAGVTKKASASGVAWEAPAGTTSIHPINNGKIDASLQASILGRQVDVPANWGMAAGAAESVLSILGRGGIVGAVGIGLVGWLASYGLEYVAGQLKKTQTAAATVLQEWVPCGQTCWASGFPTPQEACTVRSGTVGAVKGTDQYGPNAYYCNGGVGGFALLINRSVTCSSGATPVNGQCPTSSTPATDSDLAPAKAGVLPDAAAEDARKKGVPIPLNQPTVSPTPVDVWLSDPYQDPVTGKWYRDKARVTPQPSTPETAKMDVTKQEVNPDGTPATNPDGSPKAPEEQKTECEKNPEGSGCKPLDAVEDVELQQNEITLSISPVSGFGPDSGTCPASQTLFSKGGQSIVWSWSMYCDFASGIRPLIVGFAWLAAALMVVGVGRGVG